MKRDKKKVPRQSVSRRVLKGAAISAAAVSGANLLESKADATADGNYPATTFQNAEFDFTNQSGALQPDTTLDSACQFCNSLCRLKVHLKDERIIDVLGEPDDPVQAGGFCVKGPMMTQLVYNCFRLTRPMKRVAGEKGDPDSKFEPRLIYGRSCLLS